MVNYRAFNALQVNAGETGSLANAWGVLKGSSVASGSIYLEAQSGSTVNLPTSSSTYVTMSIQFLAQGIPFPCYVRKVEVSAGTVYLLA